MLIAREVGAGGPFDLDGLAGIDAGVVVVDLVEAHRRCWTAAAAGVHVHRRGARDAVLAAVAVMTTSPAANAVTTPLPLTSATPGAELVQVNAADTG